MLLVPGSRQNVTRRLQRLYHAGFLDRPKAQLPLRYSGELSEFIYSPTSKTSAYMEAFEERMVSERKCRSVSSLFLAHSISVSEILILIEEACQEGGMSFESEQDILSTVQGSATQGQLRWQVFLKSVGKTIVVPDAVFAIERKDASARQRRLYFCLEVDRGTMPLYRRSLRLSSIRRKALAYSQSRKNKILKKKFDIPGFQVLFVTRSGERLERMKETCKILTGGRPSSLFLFATQDELCQGDAFAVLGMI